MSDHTNGSVDGRMQAEEPAKPLNKLLTGLPTTIFSVMTALAIKHKTVNLGQGFPDEEGPDRMKQLVGEITLGEHNQYPPMLGVPELREAVARHSKLSTGISVDPASEVLVTVGATEALAAAFMGLLNTGDEVIIFDPQYDAYKSMAERCGAVVVPVKLDEARGWSVPRQELAAAFSERTKLILVNTPHNPTGKVFTQSELQDIAELCRRHDVLAVCDEVYEQLVFSGAVHHTLRALPGMRQRCIRIGSAGKTFSFTAWKVGWVSGPARLVGAVAKAHQFLVFTVPSNLQRAVAYGLKSELQFCMDLAASLEKRREYLAQRLTTIGFKVLPTQGSYFLVADFRPLLPEGSTEDDVDFCNRLTAEAGVTVLPVSAFYASPKPPTFLVRFVFCKTQDKLEKAADLLDKYFSSSKCEP